MLVLTIIDQGASSVSNFALAFLVAHHSGPRALGIFALVTSTYVITQGVVRSFSSNCLLTRPETDDAVMSHYERGGYLTAMLLSTLMAMGVLAVSLALARDFALPFFIFGLSFPLMALQDFSRYIGISRHDPGYAIRLDVAWLVLFLVIYAFLHHKGLVSMPWLFGAWTVSGAAVGLTTLRTHLARGLSRRVGFWLRSERAVGLRFAGQFLVASITNYIVFYLLVLFVISVAAVGTIKLALLSVGPVTVMSTGIQSALIPLASKRFRRDRQGALRLLFLAGFGMALATASWAALMYFAPVHLLRGYLGPTWPLARQLIPLGGLSVTLMAVAGAGNCGLQALRAAKQTLRIALAFIPIALGFPIAGAAISGAHGYVVAASAAAAIYVVAVWAVLLRVSRISHFGEASDSPTAEPLTVEVAAAAS